MQAAPRRRSAAERRRLAKVKPTENMEPVQEMPQEYDPTTSKKAAIEIRPSSEPVSESEVPEDDPHNDTDDIEKDLRDSVEKNAKILHSCDEADLCHTDELAMLHFIDHKTSHEKPKRNTVPSVAKHTAPLSDRSKRRERDAQFLELKKKNKEMDVKQKEALTKRANEELYRIKHKAVDQSERNSVTSLSYYSAQMDTIPVIAKEPIKLVKSKKPLATKRPKSRSISATDKNLLAPVKEYDESREDIFENALILAPELKQSSIKPTITKKRRATVNLNKALNIESQNKRHSSNSPKQKSPLINSNSSKAGPSAEQEKTKKKVKQTMNKRETAKPYKAPETQKATTPNKKAPENDGSWNFSTNVFKDKFKKKEEEPAPLPKVPIKSKAEISKQNSIYKKPPPKPEQISPEVASSPKRQQKAMPKPSPVSSPYMKTQAQVVSANKSSKRKIRSTLNQISSSPNRKHTDTSKSKDTKSPIRDILEKVKEAEQGSISSGKKKKSIYEREYDSATAAPSFRQLLATVKIEQNFHSQ